MAPDSGSGGHARAVGSRTVAVFVVLLVAVVVATVAADAGLLPRFGEHHDRAVVTLLDDRGERLATVEVAVADTPAQRRTGLSEHDSLSNGSGMLFVHAREGEFTYVMRGMDFPIDIVFVDADRRVTRIYNARAPDPGEDGSDLQYTGRGKYVLEVPRGYADAVGLEVGHRIEITYLEAE